jgi:hypothetical protein
VKLAGNVGSREERVPHYDSGFTSKEEDKQRWCSFKSQVNNNRYIVCSIVDPKVFVTIRLMGKILNRSTAHI